MDERRAAANGRRVPAAAVLKDEIYVVGGGNGTEAVADVQIYNPATNAWSSGPSYPVAISEQSAAVVKNVLYVFGGNAGGGTPSNAVWAYNPKTKAWTGQAAMPTARFSTTAVVENNIIYVIGGAVSDSNFVATVESYNPATNTWTEEAPLLGSRLSPAAGLQGTPKTGYTIVAADGATQPGQVTGDTEGYDATTNNWTEFASDPTARVYSCFGSIGAKFYDVGGYLNNAGAAATVKRILPAVEKQMDDDARSLAPGDHARRLRRLQRTTLLFRRLGDVGGGPNQQRSDLSAVNSRKL
ncbi:MAG: Kelch repeat-containing protein [Terriglobales bacterium]